MIPLGTGALSGLSARQLNEDRPETAPSSNTACTLPPFSCPAHAPASTANSIGSRPGDALQTVVDLVPMNAQDLPFERILDGAKQFIIPVFQRDYSWEEDQCQQLWDDILRVGSDSERPAHFLGSIVYLAGTDHSANIPQWLLIDGQQRLTTLTLLLLALRDRLREESDPSSNGALPSAEEIEDRFLLNRHGSDERRHKLVLRRLDHATLRAVLTGEDLPVNPADRIIENLAFFVEHLHAVDARVVWSGLRKLVLVDVALTPGQDDPQMIFESLNSTGVDLTQADLIRNYILMRVPEPKQTRLYETYWQRVESLFRGSVKSFDSFARDYMALHTRATKQARESDSLLAFAAPRRVPPAAKASKARRPARPIAR